MPRQPAQWRPPSPSRARRHLKMTAVSAPTRCKLPCTPPTLVDAVLAESCLPPSKTIAKGGGKQRLAEGGRKWWCARSKDQWIPRPPPCLSLECTQHPLAPPHLSVSASLGRGGLTSWEEAVSGTNLFSPCFSSSRPKERLSSRQPSSERLGARARGGGHPPTRARPEHLLSCRTILQFLSAVTAGRCDGDGVSTFAPHGRKGSLDTCSDSSTFSNTHLTHGDSDQHSVR